MPKRRDLTRHAHARIPTVSQTVGVTTTGRRTIWRMKSFNQILVQLLESGPTEIMTLIERALKVKPLARGSELLAGDLFRLALREEKGLTIAQYPNYTLKRSIPHDFVPEGMYAKWTLKTLQEHGGQIELRDLVEKFPRGTYETNAQPLWVYLHIQKELSRFVAQLGALKIDLKQSVPANVRASIKRESDLATSAGINDNIHEAHLEALIAENLDSVEGGLRLVRRQYNAPPVGRIDLLCRDRRGSFVVIEIKKFRASALCAKISETPFRSVITVEGGKENAHEEVRKWQDSTFRRFGLAWCEAE